MALTCPLPSPHPAWAVGGGYRRSIFLLHKAQLGASRVTRHSIFFGDGWPIAEASGQSSPSLESTTQISGEVTSRSTKPVSSPGSTRSLTSASKLWPSRRHGLLVDGSLLTDAVELVEMTGPRKTGASLTFSASLAQPQARRRLLPRSAS